MPQHVCCHRWEASPDINSIFPLPLVEGVDNCFPNDLIIPAFNFKLNSSSSCCWFFLLLIVTCSISGSGKVEDALTNPTNALLLGLRGRAADAPGCRFRSQGRGSGVTSVEGNWRETWVELMETAAGSAPWTAPERAALKSRGLRCSRSRSSTNSWLSPAPCDWSHGCSCCCHHCAEQK